MTNIPFTREELLAPTLNDLTPEQLQAAIQRYVQMPGSYFERDEVIEQQAAEFLRSCR